MNKKGILLLSLLPLLVVLIFRRSSDGKELETLDAQDSTALKIGEGVIQLFKQFPDSVWPGYNLAERPFIFYRPERWALLFNYSKAVEEFTPYPASWPDLGAEVQYHPGKYKYLAGQLAFDFPIDSAIVVAISYLEKSAVESFGFIVHEAFHQYQHDSFGDIPWEREEKYPIQDAENAALAYLEMHLLMEALQMAKIGDENQCRDAVKRFVAVRTQRWQHADPFVARYEQGQEINEGTAKYVEIKSIASMSQLRYLSQVDAFANSLRQDFDGITMPEYLLKEFAERFPGKAISPEDMPRNRIYPVGAAEGWLLDYFKVDWQGKAQQAGSDFIFAGLLEEKLSLAENQYEDLLKEAKSRYHYGEVLSSSERLIREYAEGFQRELAVFEAQPGYRFEISLNANGLTRSRSTRAKKWLLEQGTKELHDHYNIYVLKRDSLLLQVKDIGLYEQNDWAAKTKRVAFFVAGIDTLSIDGQSASLGADMQRRFERIRIVEENLEFSYSKPGAISVAGRRISINLLP